MPRTLHSNITHQTYKPQFIPIYVAVLFLIFHAFVVAYINSSFLQNFVPNTAVGTIYTIGSALTVLIFLFISRVLHRVGNYKLTLFLIIANLVAVVGMSFADSLRVAVPLFIIHLVSVPLIIFNLDVFMEALIGGNEGSTGSRRGLLLTLSSLIGAISPFVSSVLVDIAGGSFQYAYLVSAASLLPIIVVLIWFFKDFSDPPYDEVKIFPAIRKFWVHQNVRFVFLAHFLLQMFFMFMVVYAPLYLTGTIGLTWSEFGIIMFFAQLAYVFLEYPVGLLADRFIGEKELMSLGFLIIAVMTASISFVTSTDIWPWIMILFLTRVGASLAEVTTESYFFKQTKSSDAQIISFFRVTRPLAYVAGALIGSLSLLYLPFNLLFVVAGALMIPAMFFIANIVDTK